jgi:PAS domain S-box-containing protein
MAEKPRTHRADAADSPSFLAGGGELGALIREHDWTATALGPPAGWPQSLKTAIRIMLTSRQPIWIGWGDELLFFYNDPYKSIIGGKHPKALGRPTVVVWEEIWDEIEPLLRTAMTGVEGTYVEQKLLLMERNGYPEETYYTFSYSPIPDDEGNTGGIICANSDDTERVLGERQVSLLRELAAVATRARTWRDACELSARALAANPQDLPFAVLYVAEPHDKVFTLAGTCGIEPGAAAAPLAIDESGAQPWPVFEALRGQQPMVVEDLDARFPAGLPTGPWRQAPQRAVLIPFSTSSEIGRAGVLVVGLNRYRLFNNTYRSFLSLATGQISAAIGYANAYEEERQRAEALAEVDRAKTAFFSNISHEFRTPLTLMLGPLEELLQRTAQDAPQHALVDVTYRNGLRLLKLVNSLLDFSRIEAGRMQVKYQATDLATLTAELASVFRSAMEQAGLDLQVDCPPLDEPVYVDREMWEKVVLNLLSNAFKFTFDGGVTISVRRSPDGACAEMQVRDTGIGIAAEELPHVFERFHRVAGAAGRSIEGSGIGLALVRDLVELHGGSIDASSTLGVGSTFVVRVPLGTAHLAPGAILASDSGTSSARRTQVYVEDAMRWLQRDDDSGRAMAAPASPAPPSDADGAPPADGARILVVDDNADLRDYMRRILTAEGYQVETAVDGQSGLETARRIEPTLVLSDVMMPGLDGFGLLAQLRADARLAEIPVLLLSARAGEESRVEGLSAGADDYLTKPFSARELLARVASNLQMYRLRQESRQRLAEEARTQEVLNQVGTTIAAQLDLDRTVQVVVDAATELTGAAFGSFFYNVIDDKGESYTLYTLSGAPLEAFSGFPMPRNTKVFGPTFAGEGVMRSDDITQDPRYGKNAPYHGMPKGHLPVRSYLAAPVIARNGEVLGGLFFGHPQPGVFTDKAERLLVGIAAQASIAIDNARLFQAAQSEIAQRTLAQNQLHQLNETLEARVTEALADRDRLWELSEDLLAIGDYQGRLLRVSPSWTRMLGHSMEDLLARPYHELVHPEDREGAARALRALRSSGGSVTYEGRMRRADGEWRWIAWTLSADTVRDSINGVGRDVTADREAAAALRQAEEALRQAQKMDAVGKLTGGVAHDFNNLLQVIGGNLQLLSRDVGGNHKAEQRARNALAGVARGAKLASQLLAFSRRQPLAPKVVNLGRFVRGLDDMLRRALGDGIEIETVISGGLWNTLVDPFQVENALLNLAINARDAMQGHGKLTIEAGNALLDDDYAARHAEVTPGQYVMVAVTDTGCGMSPEVLEHVFEPFFTTKPEGRGTGLGLSMVYGFVKQSNGHIKIYSEPGHGTTVRFYLPRERQEEDLATDTEAGPVAGGTETVLAVEDDEEVRATVVDMLTDLGYRVLKAKDAQSALAIVESGTPIDLLFTDVVMPGPLRSPELARKARERLPLLAVLFTSGYTENAIVHGGRLDEGIELLSKPYTREALARKIRHVLRNQQQRNAMVQTRMARAAAPPNSQKPAARGNGAAQALRVLLVEDDELIRTTTAEMLSDMGHHVREARDAAEALQTLAAGDVDVLMADIGLPQVSGVELAQQARRAQPDLHVVFASGLEAASDAAVRELGGAQYLLKPYTDADLEQVFRDLTRRGEQTRTR